MNVVFKCVGLGGVFVLYGLRFIVSTVFNEEGFLFDVIEVVFVYVDKNEVCCVYNCSDYFE